MESHTHHCQACQAETCFPKIKLRFCRCCSNLSCRTAGSHPTELTLFTMCCTRHAAYPTAAHSHENKHGMLDVGRSRAHCRPGPASWTACRAYPLRQTPPGTPSTAWGSPPPRGCWRPLHQAAAPSSSPPTSHDGPSGPLEPAGSMSAQPLAPCTGEQVHKRYGCQPHRI